VARAGVSGVEALVLHRDVSLLVVTLKFDAEATIDEHTADWDIDVVCLEGQGWVSVGVDSAELRPGEEVRWPRGAPHRLWTNGQGMRTLMLERLDTRLRDEP
jgi:quercetin dioxygenase-like cupin family protein